jgi:L-ascorbate metabolism protein UlaG (beta-lactamase superfamily)
VARITFLGHATVRIEIDGAVFLTDPLLRPLITGLVHRQPPWDVAPLVSGVDAVLISHLHHDHLDLPSLRRVPVETRVIVPVRGGPPVRKAGGWCVSEIRAGDAVPIGDVRVVAAPARHSGFRAPFGPRAECLGYVIEGSKRIYFAGDTDVFPGMAELAPVDVALLPIAGWGPSLGPGHMGPAEAVHATALLRPRTVVPIHWGTLVPLGMHLRQWRYLTHPPVDFAKRANRDVPEVEVRVLQPGGSLEL